MDTRPVYIHIDHNKQEVRNVSLEKLGSHPTGGDLYEGRFYQLTSGARDMYLVANGVAKKLAFVSDLNKFGALVGSHDATSGVPTSGSGIDELGNPLAGTASIQAGDFWRISVEGTIAGIDGNDFLSVGDELVALQDNATLPAHFLGVQRNLDDTNLGSQTLAQVVALGDTLNNGQTINALNGGGQLDLRNGSDNTVVLSNDAGAQGEEGVYLSTGYMALFSKGWSAAYEGGLITGSDYYLGMYTTKLNLFIIDNPTALATSGAGVFIGNTNGHSLTAGSPSGSDKIGVIIGGSGGGIGSGVSNAVKLGGGAFTVSDNDTAGAQKLSIHNSGSRILLSGEALTTDRAQVFQDADGTIALTNQLDSLYFSGSGTVPTSAVSTLTDSWVVTDGVDELLNINETARRIGFGHQFVSGRHAIYMNVVNASEPEFIVRNFNDSHQTRLTGIRAELGATICEVKGSDLLAYGFRVRTLTTGQVSTTRFDVGNQQDTAIIQMINSNVSIGHSSPTQLLHTKTGNTWLEGGKLQVGSGVVFRDNNGVTVDNGGSTAFDFFTGQNNTTKYFIVATRGQMGIGADKEGTRFMNINTGAGVVSYRHGLYYNHSSLSTSTNPTHAAEFIANGASAMGNRENIALKLDATGHLDGDSKNFALITAGGRIGFAQSTPTARVHINGEGLTNGSYSLIVGDSADTRFLQIRDDGSWVLGEGNTMPAAWSNSTVVIGRTNTAVHASSVIIGPGNTEEPLVSRESVIIGNGSTRLDAVAFGYAVVIGSGSTVTASGVAIGRTVQAGGGIAIGLNANSSSGSGIVIGSNATGGTSLDVVIGGSAVGGFRSVALGNSTEASAQYSIAIGNLSTSTTVNQGITIGYNTQCATGAMVIGATVVSTGSTNTSMAFGRAANIGAAFAIALGGNSIASGAESIALGPGAEASAAGAVAIGRAAAPGTNQMTNSTTNSVGFGWEQATPDFLFAKAATSYLNGSGNVVIGGTVATSKLDVVGDVEIGDANAYYLGDPTTDGSWRIMRSGDDLLMQQREAGVWNTKDTISGA